LHDVNRVMVLRNKSMFNLIIVFLMIAVLS
jgi:hypothetical protein